MTANMKDILSKLIPESSIGIWWIGQGGFVFKTSGNKIIVVDPYLSNSVTHARLVEIPIKPEDIVANLLLCTHDHLDHTDPDTLSKIGNVKKFIGPGSVCRHYREIGIEEEKIVEINRGEEKIVENINIAAVFAKHTEDSVGYALDLNGITIYITGDTEYDEKLNDVSKYKIDIMFVCINGKAGNMNYREAAILTKEIKPELVIPMHYGMFKENTANPEDFINYLEKVNFRRKKKLLEINNPFLYKKVEK